MVTWDEFLLQKRIKNYSQISPQLKLEYYNLIKGGSCVKDDDNDNYYTEIGKAIIKVIEGDDSNILLNNLIRSLESVN